MAEIQKKPVKIVETVLRDAHQSLIATRMSTEQMLPIVDKMDQVGYYAVECWEGGFHRTGKTPHGTYKKGIRGETDRLPKHLSLIHILSRSS